MNIPIEKQKAFIRSFEKVRPVYQDYARFLEQVLQKAIDRFGYLGIVQSRAKNVASFSTKIILKDKYENPLTDVTDLCGARVILHFQRQVAAVCDFIKTNFEIDEANSLDLKSKLKVNEFGYRSVHYIVTPKKEEISGIKVDERFKKLKAEIQVRTLAEHVWADISHDRIYKTELTIPETWKREAAMLSAILENADLTFASMSEAIDSVSHLYKLQYEMKKAENDVEKLRTLIEIQKDNQSVNLANVLKLVTVYKALNKPEEAGKILAEWSGRLSGEPLLQARLLFEEAMLGLTENCRDIHSAQYIKTLKEAKKHLQSLEDIPGNEGELSYLYYRLGCLLQSNHEKPDESLALIGRANDLLPGIPLYFVALLESILLRNMDTAHLTISMFRTTIDQTIKQLHGLIALGIDKIPAWFAIGRCHFFLGNRKECIRAYSKAVQILLDRRYAADLYVISAEIDRAGRYTRFDKDLAKQMRLYLNLAMAVSWRPVNQLHYQSTLEEVRIRKEPMKAPVVIVAGGASLMDETKTGNYREYIEELMLDFRGTIISGGTTAGIPGLVGKVKAAMDQTGSAGFELLAYLPARLPSDAVASEFYDHLYETDSKEFSAFDILTYWADIVLSGINPADVILIGIDGGDLAAIEYCIALSLGAKVCLVAYSGRAASEFLQDNDWKNHSNLIHLPDDPLTIWAIVNQSASTILSKDETLALAKEVHEFYRQQKLKSLKPGESDINKYKVVMEWEKLDKSLQHSNIQQVTLYQHLLSRVGLSLRKVEKPVIFNLRENLSQKNYDLLAKLEHARWNAERLLEGWKYGPDKDLEKKINPCLVSWEKLSPEIRKWDYDPVDNIPLMLKKISYEIFKASPAE